LAAIRLPPLTAQANRHRPPAGPSAGPSAARRRPSRGHREPAGRRLGVADRVPPSLDGPAPRSSPRPRPEPRNRLAAPPPSVVSGTLPAPPAVQPPRNPAAVPPPHRRPFPITPLHLASPATRTPGALQDSPRRAPAPDPGQKSSGRCPSPYLPPVARPEHIGTAHDGHSYAGNSTSLPAAAYTRRPAGTAYVDTGDIPASDPLATRPRRCEEGSLTFQGPRSSPSRTKSSDSRTIRGRTPLQMLR